MLCKNVFRFSSEKVFVSLEKVKSLKPEFSKEMSELLKENLFD